MPLTIVTGGTRGIGLAIAKRFAKEGHKLVLFYRSREKEAEESRNLCLELGSPQVDLYQGDLRDIDFIKNSVEDIAKNHGSIDILINNAGRTKDKLLVQMTEEDYDQILDTNLKSTVFMSKFVVKKMLKKRTGSILNISSLSGLHGNPGQVNYASSKAGIVGLTKSLAKEVAKRNIRVNALAPGFVATEMSKGLDIDSIEKEIPLGRMAKPEEVAEAAYFLAGPGGSYSTGIVLEIDGGLSI